MQKRELVSLLNSTGHELEELCAFANHRRSECFGNKVIIRGLIELTNICRVNCDYCPMRRDNTSSNSRFFLSKAEILSAATDVCQAGITIVFLQAGETSMTTSQVADVIPAIKALFRGRVEVLLCLGCKSEGELKRLRELGASSYILKFETSNPQLHQSIRAEAFTKRLRCIEILLNLGFRVGVGSIVGLPGQTTEDLADDLLLAKSLGVHMVSGSPFVPAPHTPLADAPPGSVERALAYIAVARSLNPHWLIPSVSAFEHLTSGGQMRAIRAGANVLTVNFTPPTERDKYPIYGHNRFIVGLNYARQLIAHAESEETSSTLIEKDAL